MRSGREDPSTLRICQCGRGMRVAVDGVHWIEDSDYSRRTRRSSWMQKSDCVGVGNFLIASFSYALPDGEQHACMSLTSAQLLRSTSKSLSKRGSDVNTGDSLVVTGRRDLA